MPSPTRLSLRCTRKKPTAGASRPTTMPAPKARRMNSRSSMRVRRVVPQFRQLSRRPALDAPPAAEHDAFDETLDGAELVRHVEDRHLELVPQVLKESRDRFLR